MINWGIIGAGNIAHRFADSLSHFDNCRIEAISGRSEKKLREFAKKYEVTKTYTDHSELLELNTIDCVYIALPHQLHYEWILEALKHKKAVLCEKPAVLNAEEVKTIEETAIKNHTLFMEAMKSKFTPAFFKVKELIQSGEIGDLKKVTVNFCSKLNPELIGKTYHTQPESRGVLYDTGVYASALLLSFLGSPIEIKKLDYILKDNVIWDIKSEIAFTKGIGEVNLSFLEDKPKNAYFYGTHGELILENFHRSENFTVIKNEKEFHYEFKLENDDFYPQIKSFLECYINHEIENPLMNLQDSYLSIKLLEDIYNKISRKII